MTNKKDFAARQRAEINWQVGCWSTLAAVGTAIMVAAALTGWTKIAVVLILAPIMLLAMPIVWLVKTNRLKAALSRRRAQPLVEYFVEDLKGSWQEPDYVADFAFDSLTDAEQKRLGDASAFQAAWKSGVDSFLKEGLESLKLSPECGKCGASVSGFHVERPLAAETAWQAAFAECGHCRASYCAACSQLLTPAKKAAKADRPNCTKCGKPFEPDYGAVIPPDVLKDPKFIVEGVTYNGQQNELHVYDVAASVWYFDTGVSRTRNTSTGPQSQRQAFSPGLIQLQYNLIKTNNEWRLAGGLPDVNKTFKPRWRGVDDDPAAGVQLARK